LRWFIGTSLLLLAALMLESGLLAYAMYVMLGLLIFSRLLAHAWIANLHASRHCEETVADVGDTMVNHPSKHPAARRTTLLNWCMTSNTPQRPLNSAVEA
jgi:hypothetical protein